VTNAVDGYRVSWVLCSYGNKGQLKERKTFLLILAALLQGRVLKNLSETEEKEKEGRKERKKERKKELRIHIWVEPRCIYCVRKKELRIHVWVEVHLLRCVMRAISYPSLERKQVCCKVVTDDTATLYIKWAAWKDSSCLYKQWGKVRWASSGYNT